MKITFAALTAVTTLIGSALVSRAEEYKLTGENTQIRFVGSKKDGKHEGGFKSVSGTATTTADGAKIELTIEVASLHTDNEKLTSHLSGPDFFDAKNKPTIKFDGTVSKSGKGGGKLMLCGETGVVEFPATMEVKEGKLTIATKFKIDRTKWGMTYGKGKIDDEVALTVEIAAEPTK